ncbi:MAG TPA: hypothetical protein DDX14_09025, partial [Cyanobacteria bacterium UBA9579]|nr:hypothetical protein [Cyanobacteria bacterium UBA9579]
MVFGEKLIMQWFYNLKTAQKIIFLVVVMTLFMVLIGVVGYFYNKEATGDVDNLFNNNIKKIQLLNETRVQNRGIEVNLYNMLTTDNQVAIDSAMVDLRRRSLLLNNLMLDYQRSELTSYEQGILPVLLNRFENVNSVANRVNSLVATGRTQEAMSYFKANRAPFGNFAETLSSLIDYNKELAADIFQQNIAASRQAGGLLLIILFISMVTSVILGLYIAKLISRWLNDTVDKVQKVATGNLETEFINKSSDEIGELSRALNIMTQKLDNAMIREKLLRDMVLTSISSLDIDEVFKNMVIKTGEIFQADRCFFIEYDKERQEFLPVNGNAVYLSSLGIKDISGIKPTNEEMHPFYGNDLKKRQPLALDDVNTVDLPPPARDLMNKYNVKSFLSVPVFYRDSPLGVLKLHYTQHYRHFAQDDIDLLTAIGNQAAIVIHQAKLYNQIQKINERERLLRQVAITSISSLEISEVLRKIVTCAGKLFQADRCFFMKYNDKEQDFLPVSQEVYLSSPKIRNISGLKLTDKEKQPFIINNFEQKQVWIVSNIDEAEIPQEIRDKADEYKIKSIISVPMFYRDVPLGSLVLHYVDNYKEFTRDDVAVLSDIANQSAIVVHQTELYEQIQDVKNREQLLRSIIDEILETDTLEEAAYCITREILELFNADKVTVRTYDEMQGVFSEIIGETRKNNDIPSSKGKIFYPKEVDEYIARRIYSEKKLFIVNNIDSVECPDSFRRASRDLGIRSFVTVPIIYGDTPLAEITIATTESFREWKQEELDFLIPIVQQISIGMRVFDLNTHLKSALDNERNLRKLIIRLREFGTHDEIFDYLLYELMTAYNVDRTLHLHYDENHNLYVQNEIIKPEEIGPLKGQIVLYYENLKEILPQVIDRAVVINNVDKEIENPHLRNFIKNKNIQSFLLYPIFRDGSDKQVVEITRSEEDIAGILMLCSTTPRKWMSNETNSLKLIIDTISSVYFEVMRRKEVDELRSNFISTLTHDLRSPILAEQKALEFMLSKKPETQLKEYAEYLEDIYKTNDELLRIVNNLLAVYHYESGKFELNFEEQELKGLIDNAVRSVSSLAQDENAQISANIIDNSIVNADRDEINRALVNLLNNAIKHNPEGVQVNIEAKRIDNEVQIAVSDNGRGIPESERKHIFEKYPTIKRKIGTGLV